MAKSIKKIEAAFLSEEERLFNLPEAEETGNPFIICTNGARWLQENFFKDAKVVGYSIYDNPEALIGQENDGHDFLLIDNRYILDFWYKHIYGEKEAPVYLDILKDTDLVKKYYGNPDKWEELNKD
jgi:hypothetical protein